jgi:phage terminase large subunit-like protein
MAVQWIEDNLVFAEGDWYGQPFRCRSDQKRFLYRWYEYCGGCGQWHYDEALRGAATGDGKTAFVAAIVALEFAGPPQRKDADGTVRGIAPSSPNIPIAAASFEQADLLYGAFALMLGGRDQIMKEAPLCGYFEVYDTVTEFGDGRPGKVHRVAAVAGTNEGGLPHLFVRDELHEWGDVGSNKARVATVIGKSTKKRKTLRGSGRILSLSTAGFDKDHSLLGAMYKRGKAAEKKPDLAPRFLFDWQEAPDGLDYTKREHREIAVKAASAAAGKQWSIPDRVAEYGKPDCPPHEWIRYYANRWVDMVEESWLKDHPGAWGACEGEWDSSNENPFVLAVDMALKQDSVAVDRCELLPDGRIAVTTKVWRAQGTADGRINHAEVWDYIKANAKGLGFRGVVYDPRFFEVPARMLEDEGILAIQFDQSPARMTPACGETFKMIIATQIVHSGERDLTDHVVAAVQRPQERGGFTLSKGRSKRHIDACVAMCMGVWVLLEVPAPAAPSPVTVNTAEVSTSHDMFRPTERLNL